MNDVGSEQGAVSPRVVEELPNGQFRELFHAWLSWPRTTIRVPLKSQFDPIDFLPLLPHLTMFQVGQESPPRFKVLLVGNEIVESMGTNTTGKFLDELPGTEKVQTRCQWLCDKQRPYFIANQPVSWIDQKEHMQYDCLGLPLSEDGERVDGILYQMLFHRRV